MSQETPDHYVLEDGSERWEVDHQLHREDGPALITPEGEFWYRYGEPMPPDEVEMRKQKLADAAQAVALDAARRDGEEAADAFKAGTARSLKPLKTIRFSV